MINENSGKLTDNRQVFQNLKGIVFFLSLTATLSTFYRKKELHNYDLERLLDDRFNGGIRLTGKQIYIMILEIIYKRWEWRISLLNKTECKDEIHRLDKAVHGDEGLTNV